MLRAGNGGDPGHNGRAVRSAEAAEPRSLRSYRPRPPRRATSARPPGAPSARRTLLPEPPPIRKSVRFSMPECVKFSMPMDRRSRRGVRDDRRPQPSPRRVGIADFLDDAAGQAPSLARRQAGREPGNGFARFVMRIGVRVRATSSSSFQTVVLEFSGGGRAHGGNIATATRPCPRPIRWRGGLRPRGGCYGRRIQPFAAVPCIRTVSGAFEAEGADRGAFGFGGPRR